MEKRNGYTKAIGLLEKVIKELEKEDKQLTVQACDLQLKIKIKNKMVNDKLDWTPEDIIRSVA